MHQRACYGKLTRASIGEQRNLILREVYLLTCLYDTIFGGIAKTLRSVPSDFVLNDQITFAITYMT